MGALLSFLFYATRNTTTRLYFADKPAVVTRAPDGLRKSEACSLDELVTQLCPTIRSAFAPPWWLANGHLQTLYCVFGNFSGQDAVEYERTFLRTLDGGTLGLDITPPRHVRLLPDDTPIVVVLSGLTGGSYESYVRAILAPACRPREQNGLGYRGVVLNFRGCAGVPLTSPQLYCAGNTVDLRAVLLHLSREYPEAPLLGVGFSLGAGMLARYLAEEGPRSRFKAACVLGCPWDLHAIASKFTREWLRRQVYARTLGQNLRSVVAQHAAALSARPAAAAAVSRILRTWRPTLLYFDTHFTRIAGGSHAPFPFASIDAYYRWASAQNAMQDIRVPLLALHAADDPIIDLLPVHSAGFVPNPWVIFAITPGGGHLGWFARRAAGRGRPQRWYVQPTLDWLRTMAEEVVVPDRREPRAIRDEAGFLREEGLEHVGCRVLSQGNSVLLADGPGRLAQGL